MHRPMITSNAFGSTFAVFTNAQSQPKNYKRATKPTHNNSTKDRQKTTEKKGEGMTAVEPNSLLQKFYSTSVKK